MIGVIKSEGVVDMSMFEFLICDDLDKCVSRVMCVINLFKVVIENWQYSDDLILILFVYLKDEIFGSCEFYFGSEIYID